MIAAVSDSHIPNRADEIPDEFLEKLDEADTAVHCGDFEEKEIFEELEEKYDLVGVKGNCDFFDVPVSQKFTDSGIKFGVYHGTGINPRGHLPTLANTAETLSVEVLFHGHTHEEEIAEHDGKILLNPGSCTGVGGGSARSGNPTMMTVEVEEGKLGARIWKKDGEKVEVREERSIEI